MSAAVDRVLARLDRFSPLHSPVRDALRKAMRGEKTFGAGEDLIRERSPVRGAFIILEGFACRYKLLPDGRRQIVGLLLPGDFCDVRVLLLNQMDHAIGAITPVSAATIPRAVMTDLLERFPKLARALWLATMVDDAITREWVVNVGYRTAFQRIAHLFCEVYWRQEAVGLALDNGCRFPLTQIELADTLALSSVHVNRTLMYMRRANLVRLRKGRLQVLDRDGLQLAAGFEPSYLHLEMAGPAAAVLQSAVGS